MFDNCKKLCGYCEPGHPGKIIKNHPHYKDGETTGQPTVHPTAAQTAGPTAPPTSDTAECRDAGTHKNCLRDAKNGHCKIWPDYMEKYCARSCGYCGHEGICADDVDLKGQCPHLKEAQGCDLEWMQQRCAKTCDTCEV